MTAPAPRNPWPAAAAGAAAAALLGLGLALAGVQGPWLVIAAALVLLALLAALAALAAARHATTLLDAGLARAATAEHERNQLEHDVHRHDQLEQQLLHAKQAAETAALAKGEFLATMSHEIRTPLNGIIPMLELVAHGHLAPDQREMLRTAQESSQQLLRIVDDILDYSKLEANRLELEITSFNLRGPLEAMLQLMRRPAEAKGLRLELQIDPNVRLPVRGDPIRLRQVLGNLVGNALKFTERGGITLTVRRLGETPVQHLLRFEVHDTGIGIGHEQQARLFRAFSQADASTTRLYGGTGLGLAICKRIVDLMGGTIGVQSEPGHGSTFWFEVPLLKVIGDLQPHAGGGQGSGRVLLVSPDPRLRQRMALLLPNWGLTITVVATPQEALERLRGDVRPAPPSAGYAIVVADHDGLRHTARALHRALQRGPAHTDVRLLWLYSEEEVPMDLREGASLLPRLAPDAALRAALQGAPATPPGVAAAPETATAAGSLEMPVAAEASAIPPPAAAAPSPSPLAGPARADIAPGATADTTAASGPPRLLLVEDNPVNLLVAQKLLSVLGHGCDTAANGEAALQRLASARYDLVFMDCQMPVLDGYSATRRWRGHEATHGGRRVPIVAMTANAMAGDRQRCLDAGMDDYLSKPVAREQLEAVLRRWLRGARTGSAPATARSPDVPPASASAPDPVEITPAPAMPAPAHVAAPAPAASTALSPAATGTSGPALPRDGEAPVPVLDPSMLDELRQIAGSEAATIVRLFLDDAPRLVRQMERASATPDLEAMREAAHALKSSSANVGALALSAVARRIEAGARAQALDRPAVAVALLIAEFARARVALQAWLAGVDAGGDQSSSLLSR